MIKQVCFLILIIFLLFSGDAFSGASPIKYNIGSGGYYSEGRDLNNEKLTLSAIPLFFKVNRRLASVKVSTNYLYYNQQRNNTAQNFRGLGNIYLSAKQLFPVSIMARYWDIQLKLKFPSANTNSELGSKGFDVQMISALYFKFRKDWMTIGLGYKNRGNELNNTFSSLLNYSHSLSHSVNTGLNLRFEEALQSERQEIIEGMLYLQWKQSSRKKYIIYYVHGFKDPLLMRAVGFQLGHNW